MKLREAIINLYSVMHECQRKGNYISADRIALIIDKMEKLEELEMKWNQINLLTWRRFISLQDLLNEEVFNMTSNEFYQRISDLYSALRHAQANNNYDQADRIAITIETLEEVFYNEPH